MVCFCFRLFGLGLCVLCFELWVTLVVVILFWEFVFGLGYKDFIVILDKFGDFWSRGGFRAFLGFGDFDFAFSWLGWVCLLLFLILGFWTVSCLLLLGFGFVDCVYWCL